ncbi:hypothetical protein CC1G_08779 [Coprinopsis cinerea okayama7|uniref:Uncharacterized protein n=1 Tax=Coprinopsis cinerea (strain Okayama-7 / 130 / ATCC MYA-4618 / FGSC 9003) TaxID=240176 RepID=A8N429_COPC7|nr:hypothetical protein CC1G_08779 [Coprinopsis cinerea okayama7\|eukprot:XP_001829624.2 hypothetical protein CC1G_08779 [Coprinopsis cinerea okayama7\
MSNKSTHPVPEPTDIAGPLPRSTHPMLTRSRRKKLDECVRKAVNLLIDLVKEVVIEDSDKPDDPSAAIAAEDTADDEPVFEVMEEWAVRAVSRYKYTLGDKVTSFSSVTQETIKKLGVDTTCIGELDADFIDKLQEGASIEVVSVEDSALDSGHSERGPNKHPVEANDANPNALAAPPVKGPTRKRRRTSSTEEAAHLQAAEPEAAPVPCNGHRPDASPVPSDESGSSSGPPRGSFRRRVGSYAKYRLWPPRLDLNPCRHEVATKPKDQNTKDELSPVGIQGTDGKHHYFTGRVDYVTVGGVGGVNQEDLQAVSTFSALQGLLFKELKRGACRMCIFESKRRKGVKGLLNHLPQVKVETLARVGQMPFVLSDGDNYVCGLVVGVKEGGYKCYHTASYNILAKDTNKADPVRVKTIVKVLSLLVSTM